MGTAKASARNPATKPSAASIRKRKSVRCVISINFIRRLTPHDSNVPGSCVRRYSRRPIAEGHYELPEHHHFSGISLNGFVRAFARRARGEDQADSSDAGTATGAANTDD